MLFSLYPGCAETGGATRLSVKKQIEGQIICFYNESMHQVNTIKDGRIVENSFHALPLSRINEDPREINTRVQRIGYC